MKCPSCGSEKIAHSSWHLKDLKQGNVFASKPYRCMDCWERFWISKGFGQLFSSKIVIAALLFLFILIVVVPFLMHEGGPEKGPQVPPKTLAPDIILPKPGQDSAQIETRIPDKDNNTVQNSTANVKASLPESEKIDLQTRILRRLEVATSSETITLNIFADAPIDDYQYRFLDSPLRLVLDVKGEWRSEEKFQLNLDRHWVSRIRLGLHPGFMRLVFDISGENPAPPTFKATRRGLLVFLTR